VADRPAEPRLFDTPAEFRAWLEANHASATELWVGYYKKGTGKTSMSYAEAVEEALCFGWIDGLTRSYGEYYANRFTPRRKGSGWSRHNLERVARLLEEGRMHPAGLRAYEERDRKRDGQRLADLPSELAPEMLDRLRANEAAWRGWLAAPPSYRKAVGRWVLDAKRDETRERRLAGLIEDSAAGRKVKPFRYFDRNQAGGSGDE
jgi:uncharacterized protein YdeI (YjbR/CyaY-like superfamily)